MHNQRHNLLFIQSYSAFHQELLIKISYRFERSHGKKISHHRGEPWSQTGLGDETQLEFSKANHIISSLPVPTGNV
jgi:hypothetical protein